MTSWVIVSKTTRQAVLETYNSSVAKFVNTEKYEAIPIREYLASLNRKNHDAD